MDLAGAGVFKEGKQLLKNNAPETAYLREGDWVRVIFKDRNNNRIETRVKPGREPECDCSCSVQEEWCAHGIAALLYVSRFRTGDQALPGEGEEAAGEYGGLKTEDFATLISQHPQEVEAEVHIQIESAFPHVPCKWENAVLTVKLKSAQREYIGNLTNLRQLFFEKKLAISLRLSQFSLQDRGIIRFLAINAEPDNSKLLLNSEQTAEFFHELVDFPRFTREGRRIIIHDGMAEAALLREVNGSKVILTPGILVGQVPLPIHSAKVITGRAGCWVGRLGEYFWIPARQDVGWLRSFFRQGQQVYNTKTQPSPADLPMQIVDWKGEKTDTELCEILLDGALDANGLSLQMRFLYGCQLLAPDQARLGCDGRRFFQRDEQQERRFRQELAMLGAQEERSIWYLRTAEAIGGFFDDFLPGGRPRSARILLGGGLAKLTANSHVPELAMRTRVTEALDNGWRIEFEFIKNGGMPVTLEWKRLQQAVKANDNYCFDNNLLVRLTGDMRALIGGLENLVLTPDWENGNFVLPYYGAYYYNYLTRNQREAQLPEVWTQTQMNTQQIKAPELREIEFAGTLRNYQEEGVDWLDAMLNQSLNVILADEMGLGKTVQILALLARRRRREDKDPVLLICPASLVENWRREAERFVPQLKTIAPGEDREQVWKKAYNYDLLIISYAVARLDHQMLRKIRFDSVILDEAQHIKNPDTANSQSCKALKCRHRVVLTGTPLENSAEDLWSIFDFLQPGFLGSFNAFRKRYQNIANDPVLQQDLAARVAPFVKRRTKNQVAQDLPEKIEQVIYCEMPPEQRSFYNELLSEGKKKLSKLLSEGKNKPENRFEILTLLLRLRQICCHPALLDGGSSSHDGGAIPSAKFELLKELVLQQIDSNHKILIFSQFTSLLAVIKEWLESIKIPFCYLDGSTRNRQDKVDQFNNSPEIPVFLLSLKAGGTGLNLT